jgi:hypothetical protein
VLRVTSKQASPQEYGSQKGQTESKSPSIGSVKRCCAPISSEDHQHNHETINNPYAQALDGYIPITQTTTSEVSNFSVYPTLGIVVVSEYST